MEAVKESISELREICQMSFHRWGGQEGAFLQIRKISIYVTYVLLHFPITANGVSPFSDDNGNVSQFAIWTKLLGCRCFCTSNLNPI